MTINDLLNIKELKLIQNEFNDDPVCGGYTSDLLSDVMANAKAGSVLITIQAHINTIAVARLVGIGAIIIANHREIHDDMIQTAKKEKIAVFQSSLNQFDLSVLIGTLISSVHAG
jgi:hypothetical protein